MRKKDHQKQAAERLEISERHLRRLLANYRQNGDEALVSGHRGKPSNNRMDDSKSQAIVEFMKDKIFEGFGPTLLTEKPGEYAGIQTSKETVRQLMIEEGLHRPKTKKRVKSHPLREARARRGELVQIDGSYHAWLEDRGPKACLLLFVDDATHEVLAAQFVAQETYFAYAELVRLISKPVTFYNDLIQGILLMTGLSATRMLAFPPPTASLGLFQSIAAGRLAAIMAVFG